MRPNRSLPFLFLLLLVAGSAGSVVAQSFTLEQVMSSPFPSELTVSKRGDKLAWAFDAEGKRNIWVAEGPAFAAGSDGGTSLAGFRSKKPFGLSVNPMYAVGMTG